MDLFSFFSFFTDLSTYVKIAFFAGVIFGFIFGFLFAIRFATWRKLPKQADVKFLHSCAKLGKNRYPTFHAKGKKIFFSNCEYYNKGKCEKDGAKCSAFNKIC